MTDQKPCPRCGCTVSDATTYYFIPLENLRWHSRCWELDHQKEIEDQKEEETQ